MSYAGNQQKFCEDAQGRFNNEHRLVSAQKIDDDDGRVANDCEFDAGDINAVRSDVEEDRLLSDTSDHEFQLSTKLQPSEEFEVRDKRHGNMPTLFLEA